MIAAYAMALQMLLGAVPAARADASGVNPFVICYGLVQDGGGDAGEPAKVNHDICALACAQATSAAADLSASVVVALPARASETMAARADAAFVLARPPSPRLSQGPPDCV